MKRFVHYSVGKLMHAAALQHRYRSHRCNCWGYTHIVSIRRSSLQKALLPSTGNESVPKTSNPLLASYSFSRWKCGGLWEKKMKTLSFQSDCFKQYSWLHYSPTLKGALPSAGSVPK